MTTKKLCPQFFWSQFVLEILIGHKRPGFSKTDGLYTKWLKLDHNFIISFCFNLEITLRKGEQSQQSKKSQEKEHKDEKQRP